ncbi:hypothetical protein F4821DRAFT_260026 [Hypoxylon rubiginosum]|uniref:Uncharacterized protein n=1 Tax=Hypoxylon rubiginosum TaxID=110542 RepID=A0ACC0D0Q5_9PEZI|nr:hypothetical protein F4821DRAFT_260026 [Hypoxylon rubiginosum]
MISLHEILQRARWLTSTSGYLEGRIITLQTALRRIDVHSAFPYWTRRVEYFLTLSKEERTRYCSDFLKWYSAPGAEAEDKIFSFPLLYQFVWTYRREFRHGDGANWFDWWENTKGNEIRLEDDLIVREANESDEQLLLDLKQDPYTYYPPGFRQRIARFFGKEGRRHEELPRPISPQSFESLV